MKTRNFLIIISGFCLIFVSLLVQAEEAQIKLRTNESGQLIDLNSQEKTEIKANVDADLKLSAPGMLRLDGRVPVLLIPIEKGSSEVKINPPSFKEAAADVGQKEVSYLVSEVMIGIQQVQKEIQRKNYDEALSKVDVLQKKYPNVAFIDFVRGSVLLLKGRKNEARKAVKRALEIHPNFQDGKDFLKSLGDGGAGE